MFQQSFATSKIRIQKLPFWTKIVFPYQLNELLISSNSKEETHISKIWRVWIPPDKRNIREPYPGKNYRLKKEVSLSVCRCYLIRSKLLHHQKQRFEVFYNS